jgi:hypothetical protein
MIAHCARCGATALWEERYAAWSRSRRRPSLATVATSNPDVLRDLVVTVVAGGDA